MSGHDCLTLFNSNHDDHIQHLTLKSSPITVAAILYSTVFQFFRCYSFKFCPILIKIGSYDLWTDPHRSDWTDFFLFIFVQKLLHHKIKEVGQKLVKRLYLVNQHKTCCASSRLWSEDACSIWEQHNLWLMRYGKGLFLLITFERFVRKSWSWCWWIPFCHAESIETDFELWCLLNE